MLKAKIKIWVFVLLLCVVVNYCGNIVKEAVNKKNKIKEENKNNGYEIIINDSMAYDSVINEYMTLNSYESKIIREGNIDEANVVVCINDTGKDWNVDGKFIKINEKFYSPIVVYMRHMATNSKNKIVIKESNSDGNCEKVNLIELIEAVENELKWKDLGYSGDYLKGKVKVCVPNENCWYYNNIVECIRNCIRDNEASEDEADRRAKEFLNKCIKVNDLSFTLKKWNDMIGDVSSVDGNGLSLYNCVAIGPEFVGLKCDVVDGFGVSRSKGDKKYVGVCRCGNEKIEGEIWIRNENEDESVNECENKNECENEDVNKWIWDLAEGRKLIGEWSEGKGWMKVKDGSEVWRMWLMCGWRVG